MNERQENVIQRWAPPLWCTAPEWANYMAQDSCGRWYWYELLPKLNEPCRMWEKVVESKMQEATVDSWEKTLQQRPEE